VKEFVFGKMGVNDDELKFNLKGGDFK